jgi:catechol 2,3-dioxygenase-like lactoylglutathione lyase family enzyme
MRHVALHVADAQRSAEFYEHAFEMKRVDEKFDGHMVVMTFTGVGDILSLSDNTVPHEFYSQVRGEIGTMGGVDHFGIEVELDDFEEAAERLTTVGAKIIERVEILPGFPSIFLYDPDDYIIQMYAFSDPIKARFP